MALPRARFTVRTLMVAVAVAGVAIALMVAVAKAPPGHPTNSREAIAAAIRHLRRDGEFRPEDYRVIVTGAPPGETFLDWRVEFRAIGGARPERITVHIPEGYEITVKVANPETRLAPEPR